mmetsp:Transcript_70530/g.138524  ORF Transcript_70530/g.138524 Transcript_70530/m.138524 type:complete len:457 (+) Transcript_70530:270-1640(+)
MSLDEKQNEMPDSVVMPGAEDESNAANTSMDTWDHARFLLEQGKTLYNSWTSVDAGLLEFQAARTVIEQVDAPELLLDATLWIAHAHMKLKQYDAAAQNYFAAIRIMEQQHGMYSHPTEQGYLWLAKALGDAGDVARSLQATLTAARIEHYLAGPVGPHKSRAILQQTLYKEYQYSAADISTMWAEMKESIRWELEGDRLVTAGDLSGAFHAYQEAASLERLHWGFQDNLRLTWLHRKAAVALVQPTSERMTKIDIVDCPWKDQPMFCQQLQQGDDYYLGKFSPGMATEAYARAIGAFETKTSSPQGVQAWQVGLGFILPLFIFLYQWRRFSKSAVQDWNFIKSFFSKETKDPNSTAKLKPELVSSRGTQFEAPKQDVLASKIPSSTLKNPLAESAAGQEILPALQDSRLVSFKYQDDVASSVESLGRVLAGFETHMEFDHDDVLRTDYHRLSPIE